MSCPFRDPDGKGQLEFLDESRDELDSASLIATSDGWKPLGPSSS